MIDILSERRVDKQKKRIIQTDNLIDKLSERGMDKQKKKLKQRY